MHEVAERAQRLIDVTAGLRPVDLVEVDPVGVEPAQALLALADDPSARVAARVRVFAHRRVELGGEHDVVAPAAGQRLADDAFGLTRRVDVGGIDEVDAGVEGGVDDRHAVVLVLVAPGPEHHRPEAQRADGHSGSSQRSVLHAAKT